MEYELQLDISSVFTLDKGFNPRMGCELQPHKYDDFAGTFSFQSPYGVRVATSATDDENKMTKIKRFLFQSPYGVRVATI